MKESVLENVTLKSSGNPYELIKSKEFSDVYSQYGIVLAKGVINNFSRTGLFKALNLALGGSLLNYNFRSTPRNNVAKGVYTASEYPADTVIPQHNENSYTNAWPAKLAFVCEQPAAKNGRTPLANSREVYDAIPVEIKQEFESKGLKYVRNFSDIDLPWTEVFNTSDKGSVESYCAENNIQFNWINDNHLRTEQTLPPERKHHTNGQSIWFNQAHLFHISTHSEEMHKTLNDLFGLENIPRNVYFGDGSEINSEYLDIIRDVYKAKTFSFEWEKGDLLLIDNMQYSHGREVFEGERRVLVGMSGQIIDGKLVVQ